MTIDDRVARGAAFLDKKIGPGWHTLIDLDRLNLRLCESCICGQIASSLGMKYIHTRELWPSKFTAAIQNLTRLRNPAPMNNWAHRHGFYDHAGRYEELDNAWHALVAERHLRVADDTIIWGK